MFYKTADIDELDRLLANAKQASAPVLIDLYADWCVSCKTIEREVFGNEEVEDMLAKWQLIKLDVTESTPEQMAWLTEREVYGPPAIFFYSPQGDELVANRLNGGVNLAVFNQQFPKDI